MKKVFLFILIGAAFANFVTAQQTEQGTDSAEQSAEIQFDASATAGADSGSGGWLHENDREKHYLAAAGGVVAWNVLLCSYNKYICNAPWAQVGPDIWDHFWERKCEWDRDWYWTNFVLHPYQGSFYYMISRGSNLNRFESLALTTLGDLSWEFLCERNAPSFNDMVYTSLGAFCVGEMLYRLSLEADEIHDLLGLAVNPTRLYTQLVTRQKPRGKSGNIHELSLSAGIGNSVGHTNLLGYKGDYDATEIYPVFATPEIFIAYNDPYGHDSNDPYSQFEFRFSGAMGKGSGTGSDCNFAELDKKLFYDIRILSDGMLVSRAPDFGENKDTTVGIVMEYDFDWHSYYLLSSLAPGFAIKQRIRGDDASFEWQAHLAGIILGTSDFYYYRRDFDEKYAVDNREGTSAPYNYNIGAQTILRARYRTENGMSLSAGFRGYAMYDFYNQLQFLTSGERGTQAGWDLVGIANISAEFPLSRRVRIGFNEELYTKYAIYRNIDDVLQFVNNATIFAKLQLR